MAGNALTAAMFSVGKGNTGVGNPTETLSSIDKGIKDVGTWAKGIEDEKQKLKTDTATKYREAELKAYENMPSNETEKANMIKGLASYKDQLYMNMKLVQNGNIDSKDNLIFQENGKQSFDILSQVIKNYGEERDLTMKRAKGYTDKDGTVVPPTAGGVEAALQDLQSRLGNPQFSEITFDEKGMGGVTFFETEIDEETDTRVIKRDAKGEPIIQKGMGSLSVLAFNKGRNQRAERVYLDKAAQGFIGEETALGQAYQIMEGINKGMVGNVTDDQRQKSRNQLNQLLDQAASTITSSNDSVSSILSDNGPLEERSIPINAIQAEELKSSKVDLNEKISYTYIDSDGKTQTGQKSKYIIQKVSQNNQIVSVLSAEDKQAAVNMAKSQLYSQLGRKVDAGTKVTTFDPNSASSRAAKKGESDKIGRVELAKRMAQGGKNQSSALQEMKSSGLYTVENGFNEILSNSSVKEVTDPEGNTRKGEVYKVQTPRGVEDMIVYHTDVDGSPIPLQERTQQTLGLIMTNPTETKDLFNTYKGAGNNFDETYNQDTFKGNTVSTGSKTKLGMDTVVEGKGTKAVTLSNRITQVIKTADDATYSGVDEDLLVTGMKGALNEALNKSNQKVKNLDVTYDNDNITITGVNSKGKTITITGSQESTDPTEMKIEVESLLNQFFQNLGSDEDITTGGKPQVKTSIRTIAQIMKEDGVNAAEAAKIFKAQ